MSSDGTMVTGFLTRAQSCFQHIPIWGTQSISSTPFLPQTHTGTTQLAPGTRRAFMQGRMKLLSCEPDPGDPIPSRI